MATQVHISEAVATILRSATILADRVVLPPHQLDRKLYDQIDKVLRMAGGKWDRKAKAHLFPTSDPRDVLGSALESGAVENTKQVLQSFYTPDDLARELASEANLAADHTILEPSAGMGALARAASQYTALGHIQCYDVSAQCVRTLREAGFPAEEADFMRVLPQRIYDRVLMNPPFKNGLDIEHIIHACSFVKESGRILAICANGPKQNEKLKPLAASWRELPRGTFRASGTDVNTILLTILGTTCNQ